jgi:hypothetical protein
VPLKWTVKLPVGHKLLFCDNACHSVQAIKQRRRVAFAENNTVVSGVIRVFEIKPKVGEKKRSHKLDG